MKNIARFIITPRSLYIPVLLCIPTFSAYATTITASMPVSATVLSICGVSASAMAFGDYSATNSSPTDATSSIVATCTSGVTYSISLNAGTGTGSTVTNRLLTSGSNTLAYNVYQNPSHTTVWGDGTLSTSTQGGTALLSPQTYTAYGRIEPGQQSSAGAYTDTITVTLTY